MRRPSRRGDDGGRSLRVVKETQTLPPRRDEPRSARPRIAVVELDELQQLVKEALRAVLEDRHRASSADDWLDTTGVAAMLGVHARTVTTLARNGQLPAHRLGKLWRFKRSDVDAWLEGRSSR